MPRSKVFERQRVQSGAVFLANTSKSGKVMVKPPIASLSSKLAILGGAACLFGFATYLYARSESRRYRLERLQIRLRKNGHPKRLQNGHSERFTILHLSDLHLVYPDEEKASFLASVTAGDYDMIVITGDIFETFDSLAYVPKLFSKRPRLGAYAVLGNHDYYAYSWFNKTVGAVWRRFKRPATRRDVTPIIDALHAQGIRVLQNDLIEVPEENLSIIGIDYPGISQEKLNELVERVDAERTLMALFHLPLNLQMICATPISFVLGGHTHGGQVRIPGIGAVVTDSEMPRHEAAGLIWRQDTAFHISRGNYSLDFSQN
jgi:predicted MPP superfamily phosphohydrolase